MIEQLSYFKIYPLMDTIERIKMSDEEYFGPNYKDYVSNSKLALLNPAQGGSPQKFFKGFTSFTTTSLALGSAVHQLTLEENDYVLSPITKPSGKLGAMVDNYLIYRAEGKQIEESIVLASEKAEYYVNSLTPARIKTAMIKSLPFLINRKYRQTADNKTLIYLDSAQQGKCEKCCNSIKKNEGIQTLLKADKSYMEDVLLMTIKVTFPEDFKNPEGKQIETFVKLKMKADNWTINEEERSFVLNDLKTTGKPVQYFMGYEVDELGFMGKVEKVFKPGSWQIYHYHRQMGMYLWMLTMYINQFYGEGFSKSTNMLLVETNEPHTSAVISVSNRDITSGFYEFVELIKRAAYHQEKGYDSILEMEASTNNYFGI